MLDGVAEWEYDEGEEGDEADDTQDDRAGDDDEQDAEEAVETMDEDDKESEEAVEVVHELSEPPETEETEVEPAPSNGRRGGRSAAAVVKGKSGTTPQKAPPKSKAAAAFPTRNRSVMNKAALSRTASTRSRRAKGGHESND